MKVLAFLVLAGALAGSAQAATPEGFRESARLAPIATAVSGKSVYVRCATSEAVWAAMLAPWNYPPEVDALTDKGGAYFAPRTCRALEGWLRGKNAPSPTVLGSFALSIAHESMHLRGIKSESEAECSALRAMPAMLRQWFGIRRAVTLRSVMNAAWANHRLKPAAYTAAC